MPRPITAPALALLGSLLLTPSTLFATAPVQVAGAQAPRVAAAADTPRRAKAKAAKQKAPEPAPWVDPNREDTAGTSYRTFLSRTLNQPVSYQLYLPPGYATAATQRYPVVYWLHGRGGDQRKGVTFTTKLDAAIQLGQAPAMIVVLVNGLRDRFYCDAQDGTLAVATVIVQDLVPEVDRTYRTIARREARVIEGSSMGGFGALVLGLKHPEIFGVISSVMPGVHDEGSMAEMYPEVFQSVYGGSKDYYQANSPWLLVERNAAAIRGRTYLRLWIGGADLAWRQERAANFHALLDRLQLEHEYRVIPGVAHSFPPLYEKMGEANWAFYRQALSPKP